MSDVKDKINKLLAMARHERSNEHESEVAMRMAERLMRQHGIDLAELEAATGKATAYAWSTIRIATGERASPTRSINHWIGFMALGVARFTDCKCSWMRDDHYGHVIQFQGDAIDLEYAAWLFKFLRDHAYSASRSQHGRQQIAFRRAFSIRVQDRLFALRRERDDAMRQAVTSAGTALVVVQNKIALRDAEFGRQKIRTSRTSSVAGDGYRAGRAAGDRVNFSKPIGSSSQKALS